MRVGIELYQPISGKEGHREDQRSELLFALCLNDLGFLVFSSGISWLSICKCV